MVHCCSEKSGDTELGDRALVARPAGKVRWNFLHVPRPLGSRWARSTRCTASSPDERSDIRDNSSTVPDIAEPVIIALVVGRAFARPVGSSGLRPITPYRCLCAR